MAEEKKVEKIKEIAVGNQKIVLKEPLEKEQAEKLAAEIKEAVGSEGEWNYGPEILDRIETIIFNPGKDEVTIEQKQIEELKRNNDMLKNQLTDLSTKIDSIANPKKETAEPEKTEVAEKKPEKVEKKEEAEVVEEKTEEKEGDSDGSENKESESDSTKE